MTRCRPPLALAALAAGMLLGAGPAAAQKPTAPPLKPGLWQVTAEREVDGQRAPAMGERLAQLPPERRREIAAQMKRSGVEMGEGDALRICLTRASIEQGQWARHHGRCQTTYTERSAERWRWRSTCEAPMSAESEGESQFLSPETYIVKTLTTMQREGGPARTVRTTMQGTWIQGDCGGVRPVRARP